MADDIATLRAGLWDNGYRPVAVVSGQKRPDGLDWIARARRDPPDAASRPTSPRHASTGILCDGLRAVDIDVADSDLADQIEALAMGGMGAGPVRYREGAAKRLILYRSAEGEPRKRFVGGDDSKVEVLGLGQQFVAYGTHPDGMEYLWRDGADLLRWPQMKLPAIAEDQVSTFLDAAAGLLGVKTEKERDEARALVPAAGLARHIASSDSARLKSYAAAVLDRLASDLSATGEGGRNDALNIAAMRAGALSARGWLEPAHAQSVLISACEVNGLARADGGASVRATLNSGWRAGLANPARDPEDREDASDWPCVINLKARREARNRLMDDGSIIDEETGEVLSAAPSIVSSSGLSDAMTRVPGLVGEATDWICATARRPSRPLALAAALVTVGTLAGRRFSGPTGAGTHLYIMSLAPTGAGKQHPQDCVGRLLKASGKPEYLGAPSYMSMSALIRELQSRPVMVSCQDEYGAFLKRANSRKASSHDKGISEVMRNLWGLSFQPYRTPAWANQASQDVGSVAFSLLGSSTPDEMIGALSGDDVSNGFLNRFLVIDGGPRQSQREPCLDPRIVPDTLAMGLSTIPYGRDVLGVGDDPAPQRAAWGYGAAAIFDALAEDCLTRIDAGQEGLYYARTAEIAVRLATIVAIGVQPSAPVVTADLMQWGAELALACAGWISREAESRMTEELGAAAIELKIRSRLASGTMTMRNLHKYLYRHVRNPDDLKRVLAAMQSSGVIVAHEQKPERGPPTTFFALAM